MELEETWPQGKPEAGQREGWWWWRGEAGDKGKQELQRKLPKKGWGVRRTLEEDQDLSEWGGCSQQGI